MYSFYGKNILYWPSMLNLALLIALVIGIWEELTVYYFWTKTSLHEKSMSMVAAAFLSMFLEW